jgi:hypothetical protein
MKAKILFTLFLVAGLISCEKIVNVDLPKHESLLVANCLMLADSVVSVHVSQSLGSLDLARLPAVGNAIVSLYENGTFVESLSNMQEGYYVGSTIPKSDRTYALKIDAPGLTSVESSTVVPLAVPFTATIKDSATLDEQRMPLAEITISFQDPAGQKNYYELEILYLDTMNRQISGVDEYYPIYLQSRDPQLEQGINNSFLLNDETIDGETYSLKGFVNSSLYNAGHEIIIYYRSVSKEYYLFKKSYAVHQMTVGNPFAEPVQVYSNIKNGLGIFGAGSSYVQVLH